MNCNVCDQLAAEMGELLLKQKQVSETMDREALPREEVHRIDTELQAARQKLIDHLRLIHGSA